MRMRAKHDVTNLFHSVIYRQAAGPITGHNEASTSCSPTNKPADSENKMWTSRKDAPITAEGWEYDTHEGPIKGEYRVTPDSDKKDERKCVKNKHRRETEIYVHVNINEILREKGEENGQISVQTITEEDTEQ